MREEREKEVVVLRNHHIMIKILWYERTYISLQVVVVMQLINIPSLYPQSKDSKITLSQLKRQYIVFVTF